MASGHPRGLFAVSHGSIVLTAQLAMRAYNDRTRTQQQHVGATASVRTMGFIALRLVVSCCFCCFVAGVFVIVAVIVFRCCSCCSFFNVKQQVLL